MEGNPWLKCLVYDQTKLEILKVELGFDGKS